MRCKFFFFDRQTIMVDSFKYLFIFNEVIAACVYFVTSICKIFTYKLVLKYIMNTWSNNQHSSRGFECPEMHSANKYRVWCIILL